MSHYWSCFVSGICCTWAWLWPAIRGRSSPASRQCPLGTRALPLWPSSSHLFSLPGCSTPARMCSHVLRAQWTLSRSRLWTWTLRKICRVPERSESWEIKIKKTTNFPIRMRGVVERHVCRRQWTGDFVWHCTHSFLHFLDCVLHPPRRKPDNRPKAGEEEGFRNYRVSVSSCHSK